MNAVPMPVLLAWTTVYAGLAGFYWLASLRILRRGLVHLSAMMLGVALLFSLLWLAEQRISDLFRCFLHFAMVVVGAFSPALHSGFVVRFCEFRSGWSGRVRAGYGFAFLLVGLDAALRLAHFLKGGAHLTHPGPLVAAGLTLGLVSHVALALRAYFLLYRGGRRVVSALLVLVAAIAPGILLDYALTFLVGEGLFISSFGIWFYGLAVTLVFFSEMRGAEGLLAQTTTTLRERTHELEISHAELELVHSELTQKEQLAAVGELAQAIAHEVRNPLAIIVNASSGLRRQVSEKDRQTLLSIIDEEAARLNELVGELLRFARPMNPATAQVHVDEICAELAPGLEPHELVFQREEGLDIALFVDAGLLRLALGYLTQNAGQATALPGRISVVLRRGHLNDGSAAVVVEVRDAGSGMSPEVMERAKKPFFTTRPRGTGLGLSIVDRIVEAHAGELELSSTLGKGTTVVMRFPAADAAVDSGPLPVTKRRKLRRGISDRRSEPGEAPPSRGDKRERE